MPRRKRKADEPINSSNEPKKRNSSHFARVDKLFKSYVNKSLGVIDPDGIVALCKDVDVEHTDVRMLILAWIMKAEKQGYFTKDEWRRGLKFLGVASLPTLKKVMNELTREVVIPQSFEDFYSYAFQYCLTEDRQRSLDIETICQLLNTVLRSHFPDQVDLLIEYLKIQTDYRALNADHWLNLYRFIKEVTDVGLQSYDSSQAWPLILDSFVEWLKVEKKKF